MSDIDLSENNTTPEIEPLMQERDLVFFDCEFTGLRFDHELTEIGLMKVKAGTFDVLHERDIKLKPEHIENADPHGLEISGYDPEEWAKEGVEMKAGLQEFLRYTKDVILVGQNVSKDILHLEKALFEHGLKSNYFYKPLDTFTLGWFMLRDEPAITRYSLREMADYFGVDRGRAHRAIDDARTTYQIFLKLLGR